MRLLVITKKNFSYGDFHKSSSGGKIRWKQIGKVIPGPDKVMGKPACICYQVHNNIGDKCGLG
jgi:hypothetical protein